MFCALPLPTSAIVISPDFAPGYVQVDDDLRDMVLEYGIEVNESTQFRIVAVKDASASTTQSLCVMNETDGVGQCDILYAYSSDDNGDAVPIDLVKVNGDVASPNVTKSNSWSGFDLVMKITASYNTYKTTVGVACYQPVGCLFMYTKGDSSLSVTYARAQYACQGSVYSISDGVASTSLGYTDTHNIYVTKDNPAANTYYSTTNKYSSTKCLMPFSGGPTLGSCLYYTIKINGVLKYAEIDF